MMGNSPTKLAKDPPHDRAGRGSTMSSPFTSQEKDANATTLPSINAQEINGNIHAAEIHCNDTKTNQSSQNTKEAAPQQNTMASTQTESAISRTKSKRTRRPPVKFVARPSKQGVGVEEGDEEWDKYGSFERYNRIHRGIDYGNGKQEAGGEDDTTDVNSVDFKVESGGDFEGGKSTKKRKRDIADGSGASSGSKRRKSNHCGERMSANEDDDTKPAAAPRRKSAISRRPRQIQPTEKIRAHREETMEASKSSKKSQSTTKQSKSSNVKSKSNQSEAMGDWKCTTCHRINDNNRKRCSECQGWRGGTRENILSPVKNKGSSSSGSGKSAENIETKFTAKAVMNKSTTNSNCKDGNDGDWLCTNCGSSVLAIKKRCGKCQSWKGGIRQNIRSSKHKSGRRDRSVPIRVRSVSSRNDGRDDSVRRDRKTPLVVRTVAVFDGGEVATRTATPNNANVEESEDEYNLDDVACCLCKCAVDFGDEFFFLPESAPTDVDVDGLTPESKACVEQTTSKTVACGKAEIHGSTDSVATTNHRESSDAIASILEVGDGAKVDHGEPTASEGVDITKPAVVSSNCSFQGIHDAKEPPLSPKTVIQPREESRSTVTGMAVDDDIKSVQMDEVENTDKASTSKPANGKHNNDDRKPSPVPAQSDETSDDESEQSKPPFQLPRRFYDAGNSLILCDGPEHAVRKKNGSQYKCDRAYHQLCHFIPVFHVPRGAWRCLICRYRDGEYLRRKAAKRGQGSGSSTDKKLQLSDKHLSSIFQVEREAAPSENILSTEQSFEVLSAPLKAKLLHSELTIRAKSLINTSLSNIRTAEHSIRAFTETSKARKGLLERIENMGLPQELSQCFMRIAQSKMRIKDLIYGVERSIKTRQHHDLVDISEGIDAVAELMQWFSSQQVKDPELYVQLFPEGDRTLVRRRVEPRTDEANVEADDDSRSSGVSLDNLRCACCLKSHASDDNDLLLCDGIGCYRAFHMKCLQPKVSPEQIADDENDHWFCPLCTAHGELIHYAQQQFLGDEYIISSPPKEWEAASDVFPEAEFELAVAKKLKDDVRNEEVDQFLSGALGISLSQHKANIRGMQFEEDEDESSDEDFDSEYDEEENSSASNDEDSFEEEKKLLKEKIDKDELDALSVEEDGSDDSIRDSNARNRRSRRNKTAHTMYGSSTSDSEKSSDSSDEKPNVGTLDVSNIVFGKRNRTKVDYRKLNDALFGDESDDEAKGTDLKFAYKPRAEVQQDDEDDESSEDSDVGDEEAHSQDISAVVASKKKRNKSQPSKPRGQDAKKRKRSDGNSTTDQWRCDKCGNMCEASKKRCGVRTCQAWRGGVRMNIRSPAKTKM